MFTVKSRRKFSAIPALSRDPKNPNHLLKNNVADKHYDVFQSISQNKIVRLLSNTVLNMSGFEFSPGVRTYAVMQPDEYVGNNLVSTLARRYGPQFSTVNDERITDPETQLAKICYEMRPPSEQNPNFSLMYHVGFPDEKMRSGYVDCLYRMVRPVLYRTKEDWELIQVDIDPTTEQPCAVYYETSLFSNNPESYYSQWPSELHIPVKLIKRNGEWFQQKSDGDAQHEVAIENPFDEKGQLSMVIVAWNGSFAHKDATDAMGLKSFRITHPEVEFLDDAQFVHTAMDLRANTRVCA